MQKEKALKELEEIKSYAITNMDIEDLLTHVLVWSITLTIGFLLNYFIRTTTNGLYVIPTWIILMIIGIAISARIELKKTNKLNTEKLSLIEKHNNLIWGEFISLGIILTGLSIFTEMMEPVYIPVVWFLVIGIAEFLNGTIGKLNIYKIIGIINVIFGTALASNVEILSNYWEFFFIFSEGVIGIIYYIYKTINNRNK